MLSFGRLSDLIRNGKELSERAILFFVFSQEDVQLFAIELNTGGPNNSEYGQLFLHGVDSKGVDLSTIGGGYAPVTIALKRFEGLPFNRVTLYQDGDFYRSFDFKQLPDGFVIEANTIKDGEDLRDRWGNNILGLNEQSLRYLRGYIVPDVIKKITLELLK